MQNSSGQNQIRDAVDFTVMIPAIESGAGNGKPANGSENCLAIGTRIAEFEILGIIGEGGFGIVYRAFDHSLQRIVAIKEYMPGVMAGRSSDQSIVVRSPRHEEAFTTGLKSFINEARLMAQFDHPALIKIHRFWEQNNTGYMAMRFYEGRTLKRILQDQPALITEEWLKSVLQSITDALDALYKIQILHRDISPENIMILKSGKAVLLDFGAARQIISDMAQSLTVILKPGYAPIEQYADDPSMAQGAWTDIYSLSAVLYLAITKKAPPSSVARMMKDPIAPLKDSYPEFSPEFLDAIDLGLAVRPERRPQTISDFRTLLGIGTAADTAKKRSRRSVSNLDQATRQAEAAGSRGTSVQLLSVEKATATIVSQRRFSVPVAICLAGILTLGIALHDNASDTHVAMPVREVIASASAPASTSPEMKPAIDSLQSAGSTELSPATTLPVPQLASGTVSLSVKPWGRILVDGVEKGVSPPLKRLSLNEGSHQIRIVNPNFPERAIKVDVTAKKMKSLNVDFYAAQ